MTATSAERVTALRTAVADAAASARPVHAPGVFDPVSALLAKQAGAQVLYVSGAVASATLLGMPDLGFVHGDDISGLAGRVAGTTGLPVVADADTGYGNALHAAETVRRYRDRGVTALHIEDQVSPKRCGHMSGKAVVALAEAAGRVEAAVDAAAGAVLVIARTDAWSVDGPDAAIARARAFAVAGADMVFVEGPRTRADLDLLAAAELSAPLVLNRSEAGGDAPTLTDDELAAAGIALVIHPVSAFLAAARAAAETIRQIVAGGTATTDRMAWDGLTDLLGLPELLAAEDRYATSPTGGV